jgi:NADH-quinone oxidoreductase subunit E
VETNNAQGDNEALKQKLEAILPEGRVDRQALIPLLQEVQKAFGYIPEAAILAVSERTGVSASEVFGVLTFYAQFRLTPQGRNVIKVCRGTACHVRGGPSILRALERHLGIRSGETTPDLCFSLEEIGCFGSCSLAPVMVINQDTYGRLNPDKALQILEGYRENV